MRVSLQKKEKFEDNLRKLENDISYLSQKIKTEQSLSFKLRALLWRFYNRIMRRWQLLIMTISLFTVACYLLFYVIFTNTKEDEEEESLPFTLCQTATKSSSSAFLQLLPNPDGVGHVALNIIYAMVYSHYRQWQFIGYQNNNNPHNIDTLRFLDFIFWKQECYSDSHPHNMVTFKSRVDINDVSSMERMPNQASGTLITTTFLDLREATADRNSVDHLFTEDVLHDLLYISSHGVRQELARFSYFQQCSPSSSTTTVAAHLRWGDFSPGERRSIRDWLFVVLTRVQQLFPGSCIHVFTSVLTHEEQEILMAQMTQFTDAGMAVHIHIEAADSATEDLISSVAHFIDADILVMSPSSLSVLAGVLSKGCVIYPRVMKLYPALSHWIQVPMRQMGEPVFTMENMAEELAGMTATLPTCVQSLRL